MNQVTAQKSREERFVESLERLVHSDDRAALAALRRNLGKAPGEAAEAHRYIVPWLSVRDTPYRDYEDESYYLVGTLFAWHPQNWRPEDGNLHATSLGASFHRLVRDIEGNSVERRFVALLNCHQDDLAQHLRHAIGLLKSKAVAVDWAQLLRDIQNWDREDRRVQRKWARAFWGITQEADVGTPGEETNSDEPSSAEDEHDD